MKQVIMIFAPKCEQCKSMRQAINSYIIHSGQEGKMELLAYNCTDDETMDVALDNEMSDVPSCKIGDVVIEGEDFDPQDIIDALEKFAK